MIRTEKGKIEPLNLTSEAFKKQDFVNRINIAFTEVRGNVDTKKEDRCQWRRKDLDWSNKFLCSHHDNKGTVQQNTMGDKRCGLPFCPRAKEVYNNAKKDYVN